MRCQRSAFTDFGIKWDGTCLLRRRQGGGRSLTAGLGTRDWDWDSGLGIGDYGVWGGRAIIRLGKSGRQHSAGRAAPVAVCSCRSKPPQFPPVPRSPDEVSGLLKAWREGEESALDRLMPLVYDELHALAHRQLQGEREGHTLQTTALINEAYVKLAGQREVDWQNRAHFFGIAAQVMRRVLVDAARTQGDRFSQYFALLALADLDAAARRTTRARQRRAASLGVSRSQARHCSPGFRPERPLLSAQAEGLGNAYPKHAWP